MVQFQKTFVVTALLLSVCCWFADGCGRESCESDSWSSECYYRYRGKRSVHLDGVKYVIKAGDPCKFETYDVDGDGAVVKKEISAIIRNKVKLDRLFANLDITGDGKIDAEEFYTSPAIIAVCMDYDYMGTD
ncbi:calcium-binding protein 7-like [Mercenaria mercenaria]|uniref:calcium-binding protein 7-like n=1 Tax=Mercenaria mercenaria TaxID=6596 RepID=UPI001E1E1E99|nr:calcium-binding protein 7-like [Mercenaria mercenaria]